MCVCVCVCLIVGDLVASTMSQPRPELGSCTLVRSELEAILLREA